MEQRSRKTFMGDISINDTDDISLIFRPRESKIQGMLEGDSIVDREDARSKTFRRRSANVQKSIQMLDESVASPPTRSRSSGLRHSSYTPKPLRSKYDVSGLFTPAKTPTQSTSQNIPGSRGASYNMPGSLLGDIHGHYQHGDSITEDVTTTNVALLLEEDPGLSACQGMYQDFLQCMKNHPSDSEALHLVSEYQNVCKEHITILSKLVRRGTRNEPKFQRTYLMLHHLEQERNTWHLVKMLFRDRLETELEEDMDMALDKPLRRSEKQIIRDLFDRDSNIRQTQLVVDWLETCAQEYVESFSENINFFSDRALGWENTLHKLQRRDSSTGNVSDRPLVTELDPDAPVRQNRILDDLDQEDENRLLQYLFLCLRAGQLERAQEQCKAHGQSWRAATLEGWRLYHDPNFDGSEGMLEHTEGNPNRILWKGVCWNMAREPRYSQFEKAMYGVLSGNLYAILPVCKSWSDYLWAYSRVLVDIGAETEIRTQYTVDKAFDALPSEYWDQPSDMETIFHKIEACESVRKESQEYYIVIQKLIILGETDRLLETMCKWIRGPGHQIPPHLTRFMAHLVLFLRCTQASINDEYSKEILEAYVKYLIDEQHKAVVSHYVSKLPSESQILWYARFLEGVENKEERQWCLQLAEESSLDIHQITKTVVENIRSKQSTSLTAGVDNVDTNISEEDQKKIQALDWLVFDSSQRAEAMKQANALMRSFIAVKKLSAAQEVFDKLPQDSIDVIYRMWQNQTGTTELPAEEENAIREYICLKAYLDAMSSFNDWFDKFHHSKPTKPEIHTGATFTEKVAHEHHMKQYEQDMDRWHLSLIDQTQLTKSKIYNVLLFTDGGWMVDQREELEANENRLQQMTLLRQLVLPGLCFLLHNILHSTGEFMECIQLADIVSSENQALYKVFRKDELQHLLGLIRDSSLSVLDLNKDPLGYDID